MTDQAREKLRLERIRVEEEERLERIKQVAEKLRDRPFFVSTIRVKMTFRNAFLMFHDGDCPFVGRGLIIAGIRWFEGEVLKSGPHRFLVLESEQGTRRKRYYSLQSEDGSFQVIAECFMLVDRIKVSSQLAQWDGISVSGDS